MLVVFLPVFVTDTKTIYGFNFVASLKITQNSQGKTGAGAYF